MVPLDYVLAVAVLTAPMAPGKPPPMPEHRCIGSTVKALALYWEILDPREVNYFFVCEDTFDEDLALLRKRAYELADAPWISDALRFPCRELICDLLHFNREYCRNLKLQREALGPGTGFLDQAIAETEQLYRIWDLIRDARSDCYYVNVRRQSLMTLRQTLGAAEYYQHRIPPHVPVWRFEMR